VTVYTDLETSQMSLNYWDLPVTLTAQGKELATSQVYKAFDNLIEKLILQGMSRTEALLASADMEEGKALLSTPLMLKLVKAIEEDRVNEEV
jgi:hypothetical protein